MSSSSPSPALDESSSEGEELRAFVNEAIANGQTAMSPRSALLSHSSLRTGPLSDPPSDLASGVVDTRGQLRKRSTGKRRQRALEVARPTALSQLVDVDISRKNPTDEVMRLREILKTVEKHAISEARRAKELQRANQEAQHRFQQLNENKLVAEQEAAKAKQEIRLFQYQLDNAQKEIERSQDVVKKIEKQRDEAEADAARARAKARKLHEQKLVLSAREEGRRLGFEAGFEHARTERQMIATRRHSDAVPRPRQNLVEAGPSNHNEKGKGREVPYPPGEVHTHPQRPSVSTRPALTPRASERDDDIISSPDSLEMSPSQLPLRNLPPMNVPPGPPPLHPGTSQSTPLRPFRAPTESEPATPPRHSQRPPRTSEQPRQQPTQQNLPQQPPPPPQAQPQARPTLPQLRSTTSLVEYWDPEIPPPSQIREYNSSENPHEIIARMPREHWVTAQKHHEMRGSPPQFQGKNPPSLLPPPRHSAPPNARTNVTPTKAVKFPKLSRPSLSKTAASWYRSWSQRKKNKPVIDPVPEESTTPTTAPPFTASTFDQSQPPTSATEPPTTAGSTEIYGSAPQPTSSWYQTKQPSVPAPSVRSQDYINARRRPTSDMASVSTRVSQFDLLSTPNLHAQSVRSGKEGKKVKEKESYLSVIKEDPSSRGNTPSTDRYLSAGGNAMRSIASSMGQPQPNFGQHSLHQQPSYGTIDSSAQNRRRSRRPPEIAVPEHDDVLEPAGVAYARHSQAASGSSIGRHGYPVPDLTRRPSRISERTTPDTSIVIDVVPPSGIAPPVANSPPHTGRNHLSPYHTFRPGPSPRMIPTQSVTSLRTQGGTRVESPPFLSDRLGSASDSRHRSRQSLNSYAADQAAQAYPATPRRNQRPPSPPSRPQSGMSGQSMSQLRSIQGRPESVRSSASRKPPPPMASQTSFNPNPADMAPSGLVLESPMHHMKSSTSLRSTGSYAKYNPNEYVDPAYWAPDGPDGTMPAQSHNSMHGRVQSRPPSVNSALSYV